HFLDSLTLAPLLPPETQVADLGSGAGFPGVPVAVARADLHVTLLESREGKRAFLHHLATQLRLPNVHVGLTGPFEIVVARAGADVARALELSDGILAPNGRVFVMRG